MNSLAFVFARQQRAFKIKTQTFTFPLKTAGSENMILLKTTIKIHIKNYVTKRLQC